MKKTFWLPLVTAFGTMIILYVIGYVQNIHILTFIWSTSYAEISLFPIFIGFLVGVIAERIIKLTA